MIVFFRYLASLLILYTAFSFPVFNGIKGRYLDVMLDTDAPFLAAFLPLIPLLTIYVMVHGYLVPPPGAPRGFLRQRLFNLGFATRVLFHGLITVFVCGLAGIGGLYACRVFIIPLLKDVALVAGHPELGFLPAVAAMAVFASFLTSMDYFNVLALRKGGFPVLWLFNFIGIFAALAAIFEVLHALASRILVYENRVLLLAAMTLPLIHLLCVFTCFRPVLRAARESTPPAP